MANHLDLEEQEQLDQIKHFWKQYGNAITWALIVVLAAFASWNFYQYWQRTQAVQAAALFEEVDRSVQLKDAVRIDRSFGEMKERFASTLYAQQAGLLVAKHYVELGKVDSAASALTWVADHASDTGYQSVAKLRLAALLLESKNFDGAMAQLNGIFPPSFEPLVSDRKGDIYAIQGNKAKAVTEYQKAHKLLDERSDYRRLVEIKLNAQGALVQGSDPLPVAGQ
jgi:predicted negative regulator of RcsB-dependent stress response